MPAETESLYLRAQAAAETLFAQFDDFYGYTAGYYVHDTFLSNAFDFPMFHVGSFRFDCPSAQIIRAEGRLVFASATVDGDAELTINGNRYFVHMSLAILQARLQRWCLDNAR